VKITLGSNIASLGIQRRLAENTTALATTYERLSTGQRINRASDDAAGLAIASGLDADSRIYGQGIRNVNDAISVLEIADSGLQGLQDLLTRQRELAEQAANGVYTLAQRKALHVEANALVDEFNRIVESLEFNGRDVFQANSPTLSVQAAFSKLDIQLGDEVSRTVGNGTFKSEVEIATISGNGGMDMADLNNDGHLDVISITGGNQIGIQLGAGDGTFKGLAGFTTYSGNFGDRSILAKDFNGDGKLDLMSVDGVGQTISILIGTGTGSFGSAISYSVGAGGQEASTGDFDNDGDTDVAVLTGSGVAILNNNGNGTFASARFFGSGGGAAIDVADFNADGNLDIVKDSAGTLTLLMGDGRGSFSSAVAATDAASQNIAVGDFNRDGYTDVVSTSFGTTIRISLNAGDGTFSASRSYVAGTATYAPEVGDIDGDGIYDLVVGSYDDIAGSEMVFLRGVGDGTFQAAQTIQTDGGYREIRLGDLNEDGALDIAGGDRAALTMSTLIANSTQTMRQAYFSLLSRREALSSLDKIEAQQNRVRLELGSIGSFQSRLAIAVDNLFTGRLNFKAAESRIRDADIAEESSKLVLSKILQQASSAVLSQANLQPAIAIKLLNS